MDKADGNQDWNLNCWCQANPPPAVLVTGEYLKFTKALILYKESALRISTPIKKFKLLKTEYTGKKNLFSWEHIAYIVPGKICFLESKKNSYGDF